MVCLALFTPVLGEIALKFGAFEFFWLALFGVVISGNVVAADPLKGWMAGFLGLFIAGIGQEACSPSSASPSATTIFPAASACSRLVGAFGLAEVISVMRDSSRGR